MGRIGLMEIVVLALLGLIPLGIATAALFYFVVKKKKND
jgi:hypothetical protein